MLIYVYYKMYQQLDQSLLNIIYNSNYCVKYIREIDGFIQISDVAKLVGEYIFPPIFDIRHDIVKSYKNTCRIFGYLSDNQVEKIKEIYTYRRRYGIETGIYYFLNENTTRYINLHCFNNNSKLIIHDNQFTSENIYFYKLKSDEYSDLLRDPNYEVPLSLNVDYIKKNDDYSVIYTNEAIFLIDSNRIYYNQKN